MYYQKYDKNITKIIFTKVLTKTKLTAVNDKVHIRYIAQGTYHSFYILMDMILLHTDYIVFTQFLWPAGPFQGHR